MDDITTRKRTKALWHKAEQEAKKESCLICGKECSSFCTSHITPKFILANIAKNGKLFQGIGAFHKKGILNDCEKGLANTWTFKIICKECDQLYFSVYENEKTLLSPPTTRIMAAISLKSSMMQIAKRNTELCLSNSLYNDPFFKTLSDETKKTDLNDYMLELRRALKIIEKQLKSGFILVHYQILDYIVPIALQGPICIHRDFDCEIVNDVIYNRKTRMQDMFFCVFPLSSKTVIIMFHHKDDRNYIKFDRKFSKLTADKKLQFINYLIFKYCEYYAVSPLIDPEIFANKNLISLTNEIYDVNKCDLFSSGKRTELVHWENIPNLLSQEYAIKQP
ncbi:MAG: hypothetical protein J6Q69_04550 [Clostridia bacterium]|nr:hypothetical protein [Clostridia bacterium]